MTVFEEGELRFTFPDALEVERFDLRGRNFPKGISPVDLIAQDKDRILLLEIKDPSAKNVPAKEREDYLRRLQTKELVTQELVPKARSTYGFLHLMERDRKPMWLIVLLGTDRLPIDPALLLTLADRIKQRIAKEADEPWKRQYVVDCLVLAAHDVGKVLPGTSVSRIG